MRRFPKIAMMGKRPIIVRPAIAVLHSHACARNPPTRECPERSCRDQSARTGLLYIPSNTSIDSSFIVSGAKFTGTDITGSATGTSDSGDTAALAPHERDDLLHLTFICNLDTASSKHQS
jgi:hypothetical protein